MLTFYNVILEGFLTYKNKINEALKIYCKNIHILLLKLNCPIYQWKE